MTKRKLDVRLHDTTIGIWQDNPNDPTFREEVYGGLIRHMRDHGWSIKANPETKKYYSILSPNHRIATKGSLLATVETAGRSVEVKVWADTWPIDNRAGRRYDFEKFDRMEFLDKKRFQIEVRKISEWLASFADVTVSHGRAALQKELTALERVEKSYAESWHSDKTLGRPVCECASNRKSKDGRELTHGQTVWFAGRDGRIRRGKAFYNINNMWWVVFGKYDLNNLSCWEIYAQRPENLRLKRNARKRRERLERELSVAVRTANYRRADTLHRIIFGDDPAYMIWARDKDAFYGSNYCGYTSDSISAGKYTREEAEKEVRRVPHELEMVCPDGQRIRFDDKNRRKAA